MTQQVEITFFDGYKDWIDPTGMDHIKISSESITINNGNYEYDYDITKIKSIILVDLDDASVIPDIIYTASMTP
jgi:hypothetical protein